MNDYEGLVKQMIELYEHSDKLKDYEDQEDDLDIRTEKDYWSSVSDRRIEDVVTMISKDAQDLCRFAFELRKQDRENKYTWEFMNGQVEPSILISVFTANSWNPKLQVMEVDKNSQFRIFNQYKGDVMTTITNKKGSSPPFVIKNVSNANNQ